MGLRRQIVLALAVALAGVQHRAGRIDAQMIDLVLRPASPPGVALELMLGGELAAGAIGDHVALEIGLAAEQPEAVLDLPVDGDAAVGGGRGPGCAGCAPARLIEAGKEQKDCEEGGRSRKSCATHVYPGGQCSLVALSLRRK